MVKIHRLSKKELSRLGLLIRNWDTHSYAPGVQHLHYEDGETVYIFNGEAQIVLEDKSVFDVGDGSLVVFPKGIHVQWIILETINYCFYPSDLKVYTNSEITEALQHVHNRVPYHPTRSSGYFKLPRKIYNDIRKSNYSVDSLQIASDIICVYLGLTKGIKVKKGIDEYDYKTRTYLNSNFAGIFKASGYNNSEIEIFTRQRYNTDNILAILVHESMHNYLYENKIIYNDGEFFTDIASIYFGFGNLLLKGYRPIKWHTDFNKIGNITTYNVNSISIGYINRRTIRKAIIYTSSLRNNSLFTILEKVPISDCIKLMAEESYYRIFKRLY